MADCGGEFWTLLRSNWGKWKGKTDANVGRWGPQLQTRRIARRLQAWPGFGSASQGGGATPKNSSSTSSGGNRPVYYTSNIPTNTPPLLTSSSGAPTNSLSPQSISNLPRYSATRTITNKSRASTNIFPMAERLSKFGVRSIGEFLGGNIWN